MGGRLAFIFGLRATRSRISGLLGFLAACLVMPWAVSGCGTEQAEGALSVERLSSDEAQAQVAELWRADQGVLQGLRGEVTALGCNGAAIEPTLYRVAGDHAVLLLELPCTDQHFRAQAAVVVDKNGDVVQGSVAVPRADGYPPRVLSWTPSTGVTAQTRRAFLASSFARSGVSQRLQTASGHAAALPLRLLAHQADEPAVNRDLEGNGAALRTWFQYLREIELDPERVLQTVAEAANVPHPTAAQTAGLVAALQVQSASIRYHGWDAVAHISCVEDVTQCAASQDDILRFPGSAVIARDGNVIAIGVSPTIEPQVWMQFQASSEYACKGRADGSHHSNPLRPCVGFAAGTSTQSKQVSVPVVPSGAEGALGGVLGDPGQAARNEMLALQIEEALGVTSGTIGNAYDVPVWASSEAVRNLYSDVLSTVGLQDLSLPGDLIIEPHQTEAIQAINDAMLNGQPEQLVQRILLTRGATQAVVSVPGYVYDTKLTRWVSRSGDEPLVFGFLNAVADAYREVKTEWGADAYAAVVGTRQDAPTPHVSDVVDGNYQCSGGATSCEVLGQAPSFGPFQTGPFDPAFGATESIQVPGDDVVGGPGGIDDWIAPEGVTIEAFSGEGFTLTPEYIDAVDSARAWREIMGAVGGDVASWLPNMHFATDAAPPEWAVDSVTKKARSDAARRGQKPIQEVTNDEVETELELGAERMRQTHKAWQEFREGRISWEELLAARGKEEGDETQQEWEQALEESGILDDLRSASETPGASPTELVVEQLERQVRLYDEAIRQVGQPG